MAAKEPNESTEGGLLFYAAPIAAYFFFVLQFIYSSKLLSRWAYRLNVFGLDPHDPAQQALILAIFGFIPYTMAIILYRRVVRAMIWRITISSRLPEFSDRIQQIVKYHESHPILKIVEALAETNPVRKEVQKFAVSIMVDLLLTDIMDAFEFLCASPGIRVSLFTEAQSDASPSEKVLHMAANTEFGKVYANSNQFHKSGKRREYGGYCGKAWHTKQPQSGTFKPFPFRFQFRDNVFIEYREEDRNKSFLCLPVIREPSLESSMSAVVSIDSPRRYDLVLGDSLAKDVYERWEVAGKIVLYYLDTIAIIDQKP